MDADLRRRLTLLEDRVAANVRDRRANDADPDDPFRGLYVTDAHVDAMLDGYPAPLDGVPFPAVDDHTMLGRLAARAHLTALDLAVLVVAIAPDVDPRFERLYGYLHDDITRRRASAGLAIELCGWSPRDATARATVAARSRLVEAGLIVIEDLDRPQLTRGLRVPDRVVHHLLGDDRPDIDLLDIAVPTASRSAPLVDLMARALRSGRDLIHLRERGDHGATGLAAAALRQAGYGQPVCVDLRRAHPEDQPRLAAAARREAMLIDGGLLVVGYHDLPLTLRRSLARASTPTFLIGSEPFDPTAAHVAPLILDVPALSDDEQDTTWARELGPDDAPRPRAFRLGPQQIRRAVDAGRAHASAEGVELADHHLVDGARRQNTSGLERLARRIVPSVGWGGLMLDAATSDRLEELTRRVAHRYAVLDGWGLRRGGGRGEGIISLFAGDSGTGKTLAAEVIAGELGLELFVIDLSTVVDKYVGETEKNLERIFTEAEGVNAVLFFDEADALFGKRSEVSDAKDRYANVEVAYLLQRMETFDGLGILATNLKTNLDDAFARRLSMVVDFPDPDAELRRRLWTHLIGRVPIADDVDLEFCADQFEFSGGNIRNIVVAAAYRGAANGKQVHMSDLIHATKLEYQKLGRLCLEREFGPYFDLVKEHHGTRTP